MINPKLFDGLTNLKYVKFDGLEQPWATQIGSRAKFMLNSHVEGQNRDPFYSFCRFFYEKRIFRRLSEGHTKEFKGPHAARGPQVAHGWFRVCKIE